MQESQSQPKSDVEMFWKASCDKAGVVNPWEKLHPMQQVQVIEALNVILKVMFK